MSARKELGGGGPLQAAQRPQGAAEALEGGAALDAGRKVVLHRGFLFGRQFALEIGVFSELTGRRVDDGFRLIPPFYTAYGLEIRVGKRVFINQNCTLYDLAEIRIGDDVMIGPNVSILPAGLERNDLLCGFFIILSLLIYLDYVTQPRRVTEIFFSLAIFALALLSKPVGITFPLILFLLDILLLGRFSKERFRVVWEKIPFLILSLFAGILALMARAFVHNIPTFSEEPFFIRVVTAFHALVFYIWKLSWPANLAVLFRLHRRLAL